MVARRRFHETSSVHSGADPLTGNSSTTSGEEGPNTDTQQMEPCFNDNNAPGSHVSTFQDEEDAPGITSGMLF